MEETKDPISVILFISFLLFFAFYFKGRRSRRVIRSLSPTNTYTISQHRRNFIRLEGRAERLPNTELIAPFSLKPAAWYYIYVYKIESGSSNRRTERRLESRSSSYFLKLRDGSRSYLIDLYDAEFYLKSYDHYKASEVGYSSSGRTYCSETRVEENDAIIVCGDLITFRSVEDALQHYQSNYLSSKDMQRLKHNERLKRRNITYSYNIYTEKLESRNTGSERIDKKKVQSHLDQVKSVFASIIEKDGELNLISNHGRQDKKRPVLITNLSRSELLDRMNRQLAWSKYITPISGTIAVTALILGILTDLFPNFVASTPYLSTLMNFLIKQ